MPPRASPPLHSLTELSPCRPRRPGPVSSVRSGDGFGDAAVCVCVGGERCKCVCRCVRVTARAHMMLQPSLTVPQRRCYLSLRCSLSLQRRRCGAHYRDGAAVSAPHCEDGAAASVRVPDDMLCNCGRQSHSHVASSRAALRLLCVGGGWIQGAEAWGPGDRERETGIQGRGRGEGEGCVWVAIILSRLKLL